MKQYFIRRCDKKFFSVLGVGFLIPSVIDAEPFPANFELSSLTNGTSKVGSIMNGGSAEDYSGSVSQAGDINGDRIDDLIIGAHRANPNAKNDAGSSYVIFGKKGGINPKIELSQLDGSNGFQINGEVAGDYSGFSVSQAGDINGDGTGDLIIGAPGAAALAGSSYVVFGKTGSFGAVLELSTLNGMNGFQINGEVAGDSAGFSVNQAGDINGDSFSDIIIGARDAAGGTGSSYVVFGKAGSFNSTLDLSSLNGSNGFQINGEAAGDYSGVSVSQAGDINGDGLEDLIIGAFYAKPNAKNYAGSSYVVFGKTSPFGAVLDLSSLNGSNGFQINGEAASDYSGVCVSQAGDINGDDLDDLVIGAIGFGSGGAGSSYVVFGKMSAFSSVLELSSLNGSNGFQINGEVALDFSGVRVSQAGDINGDGLDDLIIGAQFADPNGKTNAGSSYLVFGKTDPFGSVLELSSLNGNNGFQINGVAAEDFSGVRVSQAGDINGDGVDDLIIGALSANPNGITNAGASYLIYGQDYSPRGDFTANFTPDLLIKKGKALSILPLAIGSNQVVSAELPMGSAISLPPAITPKANKLPKKTKLLSALDFDDGGVSDILVQEGKSKLKLFKLGNNGSPITPTVLSEVDFTLPKKHRYLGAGALTGKQDDKLDIVLKKGKELFVAENLGNSFSTNLQPITGKLEKGKILSIQPDRLIIQKGKKLSQQSISNLILGNKTELGQLAKGQKALLVLDIDVKLSVVTLDKKRSIGFVSENSLSATPTAIVTLPKGTKVVGPK